MNKWTRVKFQPNLPLKESGRVTASKEHILLSKEAAKEGMVLLKNEKNLLPLVEGTRIALFGKGSFDYVKGGGGSGDVMVSYVHNLYDGLKMQAGAVQIYEPLSAFYRTDIQHQYEKGAAPGMTVEPELSPELADGAKAFADVAVVVISRFSGEGWDRSSIECNNEFNPWDTETTMPKISGEIFPDGDFYLTAREKEMLSMVKERFDDIVVVLNIGGIMDLSWVKNDDRISSALLGWQGGMEGGLAMAELLTGKGNPSGKLADTFAADVNDYPSTANFHESFDYVNYTEDIYVGYRYFETLPGAQKKVIYPFGYGLSYTTFGLDTIAMWETENQIFAEVQVTNTGNLAGKEVVQIYFEAPQGLLKKPARQLAAFAKTRLLQPGETQQIRLSFAKADMASYDDLGKIQKSAYILEKGTNPEKGVNAVYKMCEAIQAIREIEPPVQDKLGKGILELTDVKSSPYPGASVVPEYCRATYDRRLLVGETKESVLQPIIEKMEELKKKDPQFSYKVSYAVGKEECYTGEKIQGERFFPGWLFGAEEEWVAKIKSELEKEGFSPEVTTYNFCTNGSHYAGEAGIRTIGMGPARENLAHTIDEYAEVEDLTNVFRCYVGIMKALLG